MAEFWLGPYKIDPTEPCARCGVPLGLHGEPPEIDHTWALMECDHVPIRVRSINKAKTYSICRKCRASL